MEIFDVYTPFLEYYGKDEGRTLNQPHLKSCQYSLQMFVFTCSVLCSLFRLDPSDNTFQHAERENRPTHSTSCVAVRVGGLDFMNVSRRSSRCDFHHGEVSERLE